MKNKFDKETARFYYLNNSGTRGVRIDAEGNRERLLVNDGEAVKERAVCFWEQCGNFSFPVVRLKGKQITVYPKSDVPNDDGSFMEYLPYEVKYGKEANI